jgi:sugar phosphate isomerase/epimerase
MNSVRTGLVSISFRKLPPEDIIRLVCQAGQQGIEWGGDVHVPPGDVRRAEEVARLTREAGLHCAAYGSYYRLAETEKNPDFAAVLDAAQALGAPTLRVWAGVKGSAETDPDQRKRIEDDAKRICALAAPRDIRIALEYHGNTLTDTPDSAAALLDAVPDLDSLWQPTNGKDEAYSADTLLRLLPRVSNVHVFHWGPRGWNDRHPLADGLERWQHYFRILAQNPKPRWALLEFAKDDSPEQYLQDAAVLHSITSAFGLWKDRDIEGVTYQRQLRAEWPPTSF